MIELGSSDLFNWFSAAVGFRRDTRVVGAARRSGARPNSLLSCLVYRAASGSVRVLLGAANRKFASGKEAARRFLRNW